MLAIPIPPLPVLKMDMLVLLMLYPVVFLWGVFIGTPILSEKFGMPLAVALFIGNIASVALTGYLVPLVAERFGWWLRPADDKDARRTSILGAALIPAMYAIMVLAFRLWF